MGSPPATAVDDAARGIAAPAGDERAVAPGVTATAERPAPPAVRAVLAREAATAWLVAVACTLFAPVLAGMLVRQIAPWADRAFRDPPGWTCSGSLSVSSWRRGWS